MKKIAKKTEFVFKKFYGNLKVQTWSICRVKIHRGYIYYKNRFNEFKRYCFDLGHK